MWILFPRLLSRAPTTQTIMHGRGPSREIANLLYIMVITLLYVLRNQHACSDSVTSHNFHDQCRTAPVKKLGIMWR